MRLWLTEGTQACVLQFDKGSVAFRLVKRCELLDAAIESVKERGLQDVAFKLVNGHGLQDAVFQASHAIRLEDFVGSFNAKSALTIRDLCLWGFPEQKSTCLTHTGFDIRVGVKADSFDFYAINYRSFSEPIIGHSLLTVIHLDCFSLQAYALKNSVLIVLLPFKGMCSEEQ